MTVGSNLPLQFSFAYLLVDHLAGFIELLTIRLYMSDSHLNSVLLQHILCLEFGRGDEA